MAKGWKLSVVTQITRFLNKAVPVSSGCWEWAGFIGRGGYGRYKWSDRKNWIAHRLMYILAFGEFDPSLDVCHHCDNRKCVNPYHLFLGTANDNIQDMVRKGRQRSAVGEANANSKLNADAVREIHRLRAMGLTQVEIGQRFGIAHSGVGRIVRGVGWKHVT